MLKIERVSSLLNDIARDNAASVTSVLYVFDFDGEILTASAIQQAHNMLVKTAISSWFDFSDLEAMDESNRNNLKTMCFELEKAYVLIGAIGGSSFNLGLLLTDKKAETLGAGMRLLDNYTEKFASQFNRLYTMAE